MVISYEPADRAYGELKSMANNTVERDQEVIIIKRVFKKKANGFAQSLCRQYHKWSQKRPPGKFCTDFVKINLFYRAGNDIWVTNSSHHWFCELATTDETDTTELKLSVTVPSTRFVILKEEVVTTEAWPKNRNKTS